MRATEPWCEPALVINTLICTLGPWYRLEFIDVGRLDVTVKIGSHVVRAVADLRDITPEQSFRGMSNWFVKTKWLRAFAPGSEEPTHFINHINGILAGKLRNDAGELVSA